MSNQNTEKEIDADNIHLGLLNKEKPLSVDEERLRQIIRSEMERFLFDKTCDGMRGNIETDTNQTKPTDHDATLKNEETITQASERRRKARAKKREAVAKEIRWKQRQRHKCRKQRVQKENNVYERWQQIIHG
jgi:hypothetical protein